MNLLVRAAEPVRDAAACAAIYAPYVSHSAVSFEERPPDAPEVAGRIRACNERHLWLVAEIVDGAAGSASGAAGPAGSTAAERAPVAGFAYAAAHGERAAYRWSVDVSVYVAAERQRRGVGRALYGRLLPELAWRGFFSACAGITLPNAASVALHESFGFEHLGTFPQIGFKDGAWRDVGWWQLKLATADPGVVPREPGRPL